MFKKITYFLFTLAFFLYIPAFILAEGFTYPLSQTLERPSYKSFGQYFDKKSYVGKENLYPNQFIGFHAGTDFEIFPEEKNTNVPIFAISDGTISFVGTVTGYGGLILEKLTNSDLTVLYGHLKLFNINLKVGDQVQANQTLAILGNQFSTETGGERKHLHFAIYKGHDLYFKGYENTKEALNEIWVDPLLFLKTGVKNPTQTITPIYYQDIPENNNLLNVIWNYIKKIFNIS